MKNITTTDNKKEFSQKEIDTIFRDMKSAEKVFTPVPAPEYSNPSDTWIITGGSSKQNNKLSEVSTWQIGQVS
jgi:hypothetical protein